MHCCTFSWSLLEPSEDLWRSAVIHTMKVLQVLASAVGFGLQALENLGARQRFLCSAAAVAACERRACGGWKVRGGGAARRRCVPRRVCVCVCVCVYVRVCVYACVALCTRGTHADVRR